MPELPEEIWTMIAKHVKREPPAVGEAGNWNDHFHQQDLTSLMRVNSTLYQVVSEVLYHSPIVQHLGLFLAGIEKPIIPIAPRRKPKVSTPSGIRIGFALVHKRSLLGKVRKLFIIHNSSDKPVGSVYMVTRGKPREREMKDCRGDKLGNADLAAWTSANDLIRQVDNRGSRHFYPYAYRNAFIRLESMSFGTWDDGRWATYEQQAMNDYWADVAEYSLSQNGTWAQNRIVHDPRPEKHTLPRYGISRVLKDLFEDGRPLYSCFDARASVGLHRNLESSLTVVHNASLNTAFLTGPVRIYVSTDALKESLVDQFSFGNMSLVFNDERKPVFQLTIHESYLMDDSEAEAAARWERLRSLIGTDSRRAHLDRKNLEMCLVPEIEGDLVQTRLAEDVRDALEKYKKASQAKDGSNGYLGTLKIFAGDNVPACPCCGAKR